MRMPLSTAMILLSAVGLTGCGSGQPEQPAFADLFPVKGLVKRGDKPVKGGAVQFFPEPNKNEFLINSEVGVDGTFTLSTVRTTDRSGERRSGAPAGKYQVKYIPPAGDQLAGGQSSPIDVPGVITIESKENSLELILPNK